MLYQISAIAILLAFYSFYIRKIIIQRKQSIKTNQMGMGNKEKKVLWTERIMSVATVLTIVAEVISIFLTDGFFTIPIRIIGIVIGVLAVVVFAMATITMKNSWRVGIPEEKTNIITSGIYGFSRNPAFVGFDLLYISILLLFFNIPLLLISVWAMIMLHLQILQEEKWLSATFGDEYEAYRRKVCRYIGRK
ncbi:MAG: isoprenylcysteine carboxylmethyltransferase family protein [Lachnospiraceae bacterium]|nr:isoprenylcysteine carboxylmethyltransferase family protein [Lachnospiraceae bacterium]